MPKLSLPKLEVPRWRAEVDYRTDAGINTVVHDMHELEELHELIERGPSFYAIEKIVVYVQGPYVDETLTVERAERE